MKTSVAACASALLVCTSAVCLAQPTALTTQRVASGLTSPLFVTHAPGDPTRLFIVEQREGTIGVIKILDLTGGTVLATPFLQVPNVGLEGEQGLLGLAFHPQYQVNGYFYVYYTTTGVGPGGRIVLERYTVSSNRNVADGTSAQGVISVEHHPEANHNGGWIAFGPDGYLYMALGDGGSGNDPENNAQTLVNNLLGKILRLDVNGDDFPADAGRNYRIPPYNPFAGIPGDDEIWAYGLRNPWRNSFDRATGDLWIGDVGQGLWEEIDFQPAGALGGANYGWRCMEGNECRIMAGCTCASPLGVAPIHTYSHSDGCSINGGYVYRGCAIPDLQGTYFFGDLCSGRIWTFRYDGGTITGFTDRTAELEPGGGLDVAWISSFGEDYFGELYVVDFSGGEVFKIVPRTFAGPDCNGNGEPDGCDIATGASVDANGNSIPDECEGYCLADFNGDGFVDPLDYNGFINAFESGDMSADINDDGFLDPLDYNQYINAFERGC